MPVYGSYLVRYEELGVGARIRAERRGKHLTLRQLADIIGISPAHLSNLETEKTPPDLVELQRTAAALGVSMTVLFPPRVDYPLLITRREQLAQETPFAFGLLGAEPGRQHHHNLVRPLADAFVGKHMEPFLVDIQPLTDEDIHFIAHDHEEFMFVLRGEVEALLETNDGLVGERLKPGDCLYYHSYLPHCMRSASSEPAETLNVMYSIRGPVDSQNTDLTPSGHPFYHRRVYGDVSREIGDKTALLRRSHGLTAKDLARSLGISARQVARIERGDTSPDLELLLRIARRFRRPIEFFLATTLAGPPYYFVQRAEQIPTLKPRRRRDPVDRCGISVNIYRPLAAGFRNRGLHPYYVQIKHVPADAVMPHEHNSQEFIYVLDGEIELSMSAGDQEVVEVLRSGDSVFLDSNVPHRAWGHSRNPYAETSARIIDVFWTPLGEDYLFAE